MRMKRTEHLGAGPHERTESRDGYANGFNPKTIRTQLGETTRRVTTMMEKLCGFENISTEVRHATAKLEWRPLAALPVPLLAETGGSWAQGGVAPLD